MKKALASTLDEIDAAVSDRYGIPPLAPLCFAPTPPTAAALAAMPPGTLQLAFFGSQVALSRALTTLGLPPDRVLGVSFGEIAALTVAGAFTLAGGALAALHAARALHVQTGGLTVMRAACDRVQKLINAAGARDTVIACVNHAREVLISSRDHRELDCLEQAASEEDVRSVRLPLPFASHHPGLTAAADDLSTLLRARLTVHPARIPVYSAVHARAYGAGDDLIRAAAASLHAPFHLPSALHAAAPSLGPALWLDTGTGQAGARTIARLLPDAPVYSPYTCRDFPWDDPRRLRARGDT